MAGRNLEAKTTGAATWPRNPIRRGIDRSAKLHPELGLGSSDAIERKTGAVGLSAHTSPGAPPGILLSVRWGQRR